MGDILGIFKSAKPTKQLTDILIKNGIDGMFAKNRNQITEALKKEEIDVIIIDFTMASDEGYRLCELIREESLWQDIPIIGVVDEFSQIDLCFKVGATDVIDKNYHELAMVAKIKAYMALKKAELELVNSKEEVKLISEDYEALNRRVELVAVQDGLTNLYTRKFAMEQIEIAISRFDRAGVGFSIILCDIDHFKKVNDTYGPTFGDEILMGIGQTLKYHSRVQDIVSRWGGEEFLMLLPDTDLEGALIYAERARKRIEKKVFVTQDKEVSVTMTFGIATYNHVMSLNMIMSLVDDALFSGKTNGRNKVVSLEI